ncbi:flagellar secreted protein [Campylobacter hyointestinalis subsp. lawsonii CCUG 27631]|uniref:flagellin n=1 Tax=Campylobacter hyointestinalis TaxID=198 RepID=UPI0007C995A3|nr:flagellin [Campylobacter hyointestinalis]ANE34565.1 flagellar secreted protein [Campylobacter hyointestinalis subsp. lawsonii CCUG 27631]
MQVNNTNSMQNYYLNNAQNSSNKALGNIAAQRALSGTDSANLVIGDSLLSQSNALSQGVNNANDAIGMLQIADGVLQNISSGADRLNELSVRSNNATFGANERQAISSEANAIKTSINDSINSASYNGNSIFGGTLNFNTGNSVTSINLSAPNINSVDVNNQNSIKSFMDSVNSLRSDIGSAQNGLMSGINSNLSAITSAKASESQLQNNDLANNVSDFTNANIKINSSTMMMAHNAQILQSQMANLLG